MHWSQGAFGYFPTYALGTLTAAQLMNTIQNDLSDVEEPIASGRFAPLLDWLRYVRDKFEALYDLSELRGCDQQ